MFCVNVKMGKAFKVSRMAKVLEKTGFAFFIKSFGVKIGKLLRRRKSDINERQL